MDVASRIYHLACWHCHRIWETNNLPLISHSGPCATNAYCFNLKHIYRFPLITSLSSPTMPVKFLRDRKGSPDMKVKAGGPSVRFGQSEIKGGASIVYFFVNSWFHSVFNSITFLYACVRKSCGRQIFLKWLLHFQKRFVSVVKNIHVLPNPWQTGFTFWAQLPLALPHGSSVESRYDKMRGIAEDVCDRERQGERKRERESERERGGGSEWVS